MGACERRVQRRSGVVEGWGSARASASVDNEALRRVLELVVALGLLTRAEQRVVRGSCHVLAGVIFAAWDLSEVRTIIPDRLCDSRSRARADVVSGALRDAAYCRVCDGLPVPSRVRLAAVSCGTTAFIYSDARSDARQRLYRVGCSGCGRSLCRTHKNTDNGYCYVCVPKMTCACCFSRSLYPLSYGLCKVCRPLCM